MSRTKIEAGSHVELEWEDIQDYSDDDWNEDPEYYDTATIRTVCYIAFDFDISHRCIRISRDWDEDGHPRGVRVLPKGVITSMRDLETGSEIWDDLCISYPVVWTAQELAARDTAKSLFDTSSTFTDNQDT